MFADPSKLNAAIEAAKKRVMAFGKFFATVGGSAAAVGGSVFAPLTKVFAAAVEEGADISKLSTQLGGTVEQVSRLRGAFAQGGVGAEEFGAAMESLGQKISSAADSNGFLLDNLQSLGTARDFMGKGLDEQLDIIAERIKAIADARDQARAANDLGLGSLLPVLRKGKAGLDEYRAAAEKNGDVMNGEQTKQAMEIQKEYNRAMLATKSTILEVGKALLPTGASFTSIGQSIRGALGDVREWIKMNRHVIVAVAAVASVVLVGGLAVAAFGAAATVAASLISPWAIAIGAAAVGIGFLLTKTETGISLFPQLAQEVKRLGSAFVEVFDGVDDAMAAGDMALAGEIASVGLKAAFAELFSWLTDKWNTFKGFFVDGWHDAAKLLKLAMNDAVTWLRSVFIKLGQDIRKNIGESLTSVLKWGLEKYIAFLEFTNALGVNSAQIVGAKALMDGLTLSPEDVERKLAEGEEERKKRIDEIERVARAEQEARDKARKDDSAEAKAEAERLRKQLDGLREKARLKKEQALEDQWQQDLFDATAPKDRLPSFAALSELAKGTMSGASIQQALGYGDNVGQRQLDAQMNIQSNTAKTADGVAKLLEKPGGIVLT
jgi:hypothetical protein